ncbi:hypothetical protein B0A49_06812, partial [Cryomyces minteri]
LALIFLVVEETYHPVLLRQKAIKLRKETGNEAWKAPIEKMTRSIPRTVLWSCIRPFQLLFLEPMCLNLCILSAILLGILYLFFGAFPLVFKNNHGFTLSQSGLTFLGIFIGMIMGILSDPLWRKNYVCLIRKREEQGGEPGGSEPEYRLPPTILGAVLVPIGLFGFGWTTYPWVHWIVPIFSVILGLGNIFVFSGVFTFLVDCVRSPVPDVAGPMADDARSILYMQPQRWRQTVSQDRPYLFFIYGKKLRGHSRFASA